MLLSNYVASEPDGLGVQIAGLLFPSCVICNWIYDSAVPRSYWQGNGDVRVILSRAVVRIGGSAWTVLS